MFKVQEAGTAPAPATLTWPFASMNKGEWFEVTDQEQHSRARCAASAYGKRHAKYFSCRVIRDTRVMIVKREV